MLIPTPYHRWKSSFDRRDPLRLGSILRVLCVVGAAHMLAVGAVVVGLVFFPLSRVLTGLLFSLVCSYFLVPLIVISTACLFLAVAIFRAIRGMLFGPGRGGATTLASKEECRQPEPEPAGERSELWDRWLDGSRVEATAG